MQMSSEAVALINATLSTPGNGWAFTAASVDVHDALDINGGGNLIKVTERMVTLMLENEALGQSIVVFLNGHGSPPAQSASLIINGSRLTTADPTFITRCENAIALLQPQANLALTQFFGG